MFFHFFHAKAAIQQKKAESKRIEMSALVLAESLTKQQTTPIF
jgi:hypothetical protein